MNRRQALSLITATTASVAGSQSWSTGARPTVPSTPSPPDCPGARYDIETARYDHRVTCYRPDETSDGTPALIVDLQSIARPAGTVTFTFTNPCDTAYVTTVSEWGLHKYVTDRWYRVVNRWTERRTTEVDGSVTHTWTFTVENSNLSQPVEAVRSDGDETTISGLGGGTSAFLVPATFDDVDRVPAADTVVSDATRFSIEGPSVDLVPTETVADVRRDDGRTEGTHCENPRGAWTFTRARDTTSEDETHTRYSTEQLYGKPLARNALASFEDGVERVIVRTNPADVIPIPEGYATFDGVTYRVETNRLTSG